MHIGLVLSGGMGKGAYQIGALTAIDEFFNPSEFEYVSAASIGVLNMYFKYFFTFSIFRLAYLNIKISWRKEEQ